MEEVVGGSGGRRVRSGEVGRRRSALAKWLLEKNICGFSQPDLKVGSPFSRRKDLLPAPPLLLPSPVLLLTFDDTSCPLPISRYLFLFPPF